MAESEEQLDRLASLRLHLVPGIGPRLHDLLIARCGSAENVLAAPPDELRSVPGVGPKLVAAIRAARTDGRAEQEAAACRDHGFQMLHQEQAAYPRTLKEIHNAPAVLYCRGQLLEKDALAVAIVGSRRCTHYGRRQAENLAFGLAKSGLTIISGLARGIDGIAHRAALRADGRTIAVAATGLLNVYPPEHAELAAEIANAGAVVTESSLDQQPIAGLFPQRNRIISGLSLGVIIIEANRKSGALHTARHAMEQGREVLALPGPIDSLASEGCHDLIRDGATLIRGVDDVLEALGPLIEPIPDPLTGELHSPRELNLTDQEKSVLALMTGQPRHLDEVLRSATLDSARVLATVTVLEMKRLVRRLPGGYLVRAPGS